MNMDINYTMKIVRTWLNLKAITITTILSDRIEGFNCSRLPGADSRNNSIQLVVRGSKTVVRSASESSSQCRLLHKYSASFCCGGLGSAAHLYKSLLHFHTGLYIMYIKCVYCICNIYRFLEYFFKALLFNCKY